ncbi:DinB family protein [Paenibacillus solisilvae]|uniref:DinB family protein n=1 Tax=Paenibacillus solisilvae TaxID=2486751 RepID=A0ABW0VYE7_9BACL
MSQTIIHTGSVLRQLVIGQIQAIPKELFDVQANGFNNTIRWNVGHIIYWMDAYSKQCFEPESLIPASYSRLFNSGTKPTDWTEIPPTTDGLIQALAEQLNRISEVSEAALEAELKSPLEVGPFRFVTAGEVYNFAFLHEAIHLGTISSLWKASGQI